MASNGFLESDQREKMMADCRKLNDELDEALKKVKEIEAKCQTKFELLAKTAFTDDQKELLEKNKGMRIDKFVELLSIREMSADTELKRFQGKL